MRVQLIARHCDVPDAVRERTSQLVSKLVKYDPRLSAGEVIFQVEKRLHRAEGILTVHRDEPVVARGEGEDFRRAADQMVERLSKMLRRRRSQVRNHQARRPISEGEVVAD